MNLNDPQHPWPRLLAAARKAPDTRDTSAPFGFATRVSALALSPERAVGSLLERFAWRAVGVAGLLAVLSVVANYSALAPSAAPAMADEDDLTDSPVALLLSVD